MESVIELEQTDSSSCDESDECSQYWMVDCSEPLKSSEEATSVDEPSSSQDMTEAKTSSAHRCDNQESEYEDSKTFVEQLIDEKGRMWDRKDRKIFEAASLVNKPSHSSLVVAMSETPGDSENQKSDEDDSKTFVEQFIDGKGRMWDRKDKMKFEEASTVDEPPSTSLNIAESESSDDRDDHESECEDDSKTFVEQFIDEKGKMWDRKDRKLFEANDNTEKSALDETQNEMKLRESGDSTSTENCGSSCTEKEPNKDTLSASSSGRPNKRTIGCDNTTRKKPHIDGSNPKLKHYKCQLCKYTATLKRSLKRHIDSVHPTLRNLKCHLCKYTTTLKQSHKRHIDSVHLKLRNQKCHLCDYRATRKDKLQVHIDSVHHPTLRDYKCHLCDYTATRKDHIRYHIDSVHLKLRNQKCHLCNFKSTHKFQLKRHIDAVHLQLKNHKCELCDYTGNRKDNLKYHMDIVHLKLNNHKCHLCDYTTIQKNYLKFHIDSVHLNLRNYKCHQCEYTARKKKHLVNHIGNVHLKLENHKCHLCNYTTTQKNNLKRHINSVHM